MRRCSASCLLLALVATPLCSADVRLPTPPTPAPSPAPAPTGVYKLAADDRYPVNADGPTIVRSYPAGLIEFKPAKPGTHHWESGGVEKSFEAGPHALLGKAVGKGRAEVEFFWADGGKVATRRIIIDCMGARPPPVPPNPPPPDPPPPGPGPDTALVARFKNAIVADIPPNLNDKDKAAAFVALKAHAASLAVVYESGAALLDLNDPAIMPKTVGELYTKQFNASVAKGIPRLPYLNNVRLVIEATTPLKLGATELTPALKREYQAAYRLAAAALAEASK